MAIKLSALQLKLMFALIMSASTALLTTGIAVYMQVKSLAHFTSIWLGTFIRVWPIVFFVILIFAPLVNLLLDRIFCWRFGLSEGVLPCARTLVIPSAWKPHPVWLAGHVLLQ